MTDILATRLKIGSLIPAANCSIEPEFTAMGVPGVTHMASRLHVKSRPFTSDDNARAVLQSALDDVDAAMQRLKCTSPDAFMMAMAAPCFLGGLAGAQALQKRLNTLAGKPVLMPNTALARALDAVGARRIGVITPEIPVIDEQIARWFNESGYTVHRILGLEAASPEDVINFDEAAITRGFAAVDDVSVDALVQVGTSMAVARLVEKLEVRFAKPVLCVNVALWWGCLRAAGIADRRVGFGRLLASY